LAFIDENVRHEKVFWYFSDSHKFEWAIDCFCPPAKFSLAVIIIFVLFAAFRSHHLAALWFDDCKKKFAVPKLLHIIQ